MIKKNIPNFITCMNLLCGCIGIVFAFQGQLVWTAYMVGIACVFDFLDGFVARLLKVHSEIGKQLDSLADMVTFGVVPGVIMFQLINLCDIHPFDAKEDELFTYSSLIGFLITIFSAIRLAKFNVDTRQIDSFIGLPTPANTILISSIPLILYFNPQFRTILTVETIYYSLIALSIVSSLLLVAELPLFALKFKNFSWADNKIRYIFLALSLAMLIIFQYVGIPFIIVLYIIISIVNNMLNRPQRITNN